MRSLVVAFLMLSAAAVMANAFTYEIFSSLLGLPERTIDITKAKRGGGGIKVLSASPSPLKANGGSKCAGCTLLVAILEQTMQVHSQTAPEAFNTLCGLLPQPLGFVCDIVGPSISQTLFPLLDAKESPDAICNTLGACMAETGVCRLFPQRAAGGRNGGAAMSDAEFKEHTAALRLKHPVPQLQHFNVCTILPGVCKFKDHLPYEDLDGDLFSTIAPLRGSDWRGKDCNDNDATVYAGRNSGEDRTNDGNCNGIWGIDNTTGLSYESEWCGPSSAPMGVATLGDSASAHFRMPEDMFEAAKMTKATFAKVLDMIADEADWPMLSWATGHQPTSAYSPSVTGPMTSVYSMLREQNRCNHRDYQNIGVNGADSSDLPAWMRLLARDQQHDRPLLAFFAMIGNDVCGHTQDFTHMTTPDAYYNSVLEAVLAADAKLPKGSHVVLVPLVDGRILYNTMHNQYHPIGTLNKDVTYRQFYDYLNCLVTSPCWGWMNSNETVRNTTYGISTSLNAQLPKVIADTKGKLNNIDVHFLGSLFDVVLSEYKGPKSDLIEPVDGFHPSQIANSLLGNYTFSKLQQIGVIPTVPNPYNAAIERVFGNQGGY